MRISKISIKANQGFTLIEVLVSLCCLSLCLLLVIGICGIMKQYPVQGFLSDDILAIRQIRMILAQSEDIKVVQDNIYFRYHQKEMQLEYHNHRLVKTPGYEIFVKDIEYGTFYEQGGCIYASWKRKKSSQALLYCE